MARPASLTKLEQEFLALLVATGVYPQNQLADIFNISRQTVYDLIKRKGLYAPTVTHNANPMTQFTSDVLKWALRYNEQVVQADIASITVDPDVPLSELEMVIANIRKLDKALKGFVVTDANTKEYAEACAKQAQLIEQKNRLEKADSKVTSQSVMVVPRVLTVDEWCQAAVASQHYLKRLTADDSLKLSNAPPSSMAQAMEELDKALEQLKLASHEIGRLRELVEGEDKGDFEVESDHIAPWDKEDAPNFEVSAVLHKHQDVIVHYSNYDLTICNEQGIDPQRINNPNYITNSLFKTGEAQFNDGSSLTVAQLKGEQAQPETNVVTTGFNVSDYNWDGLTYDPVIDEFTNRCRHLVFTGQATFEQVAAWAAQYTKAPEPAHSKASEVLEADMDSTQFEAMLKGFSQQLNKG